MKKNKNAALVWMGALILAASMFAGVLPAAAEDTPQSKPAEEQGAPIQKQAPKKKTVKTPDTFVPTDKVSADRAVAFPTDI
jgi:hypothetical protein